jgi:uncharacterized MAPEG superfamily protein
VLHGVFYVTNRAPLRSLAWLVGMVCVITLIVMAALKIA